MSTFTGNVTVGSNSLTAGSLDINGNADISGNLTMSGNANLVMGTGQLKFADSGYIYLGDSNDLQIYHNATDSKIDNYTGDLYITNFADDKDIIFRSDDGAGGFETYFYLDGSASSGEPYTVWPDSSIAAWGTGVDFRIKHDGSNTYLYNTTGHAYFINYADDKDIIFQSDDGSGGVTPYITLDGSATTTKFSKNTLHEDNVEARFGTDSDFQLYHSGSHGFITNSTGNLTIKNAADDKDILFQCDDGSGGVETYFRLDGSASSGNPYTIFPDNSHLGFGSGYGDLQLHHDGTDSYIKNRSTGRLIIQQDVDDNDIVFNCDDGSGGTTAYMTIDGSAQKVIHNANAEFSGTLTVGGIVLGSTSERIINVGDTDSYIGFGGANQFNVSLGGVASLTATDTATTLLTTLTVGVNDTGHDVIFYGATAGKKMQWDESADTLIVDGTLDVNGAVEMDKTLTMAHTADPSDPATGKSVMWSDTSGNLKIKINVAGTTVTKTITTYE